jgi:ArsR family transcriptional regulator
LDNAKQMLDKAERTVSEQQLGNVELIYGDTKACALQSLNIDCIVVNMVLHHTPSPAEIFCDLAQLLDSGGQLFVTDLCRHDQAWVQTACGDLWLGFEPEDLSSWASNAGLSEGQSVYLTQRNGFRVQIRQFIKL